MSRPARVIRIAALLAVGSFASPAAGEPPADPPRLSGSVVDAAGAPVAGAEVGTLKPEGPVYAVTTDADGRFSIAPGRDRSEAAIYPQVIARSPNGRLGLVIVTRPRGAGEKPRPGVNADGTLTVSLAAPHVRRVRVAWADGSPVGGVKLYGLRYRRSVVAATTSDDGTATLALPANVGFVHVTAIKSGVGFAHRRLEFPESPEGATGGAAALSFTLSPAWTSTVRVVTVGPDKEPRPVPGAKVGFYNLKRGGEGRPASLDGAPFASVVTGDDGTATFDWLPRDLERGNGYTTAEGFGETRFLLSGTDAAPTRTVEVVRTGTLSGRIVNPDGSPAVGTAVRARGVVSGPGMNSKQEFAAAVTGADGRYEMEVAGRGAYLLTVGRRSVGTSRTPPPLVGPILGADGSIFTLPGERTEVPEMRLTPGALLTGTVTRGRGTGRGRVGRLGDARDVPRRAAAGGLRIRFLPELGSNTFTDVDGRYAFRLAPGEYRFHADGGKYADDTVTISDRTATETYDIVLPPAPVLRTYSGTVRDLAGEPVTGATVWIGDDQFTLDRGRVDETATIGTDGTYTLSRKGDRAGLGAVATGPDGEPLFALPFTIYSGPRFKGRPDVRTHENQDLVVRPRVVLTGTTAGPGGAVLAGVRLQINGPDSNDRLGGSGPLTGEIVTGPRGRWVFRRRTLAGLNARRLD